MLWLLAFTVALLPIGTRLFVGSVISGIHEYEALFLYGSDLVVVAVCIASYFLYREQLLRLVRTRGTMALWVFLITAAASVAAAPSISLALYVFSRLVLLVIFSYSLAAIITARHALRFVLAVIAVVAVIQGVVGFVQFKAQSSIGLGFLGEPKLLAYTGAASTVQVSSADVSPAAGGRFLRVYGTFPHPNIYAGFLVLGLLSLAYWYFWCEQQITKDLFRHPRSWWQERGRVLQTLNKYLTHRYFYLRLLIVAGSFVVTFGLALSFSRSGWLAALVGILLFCGLLVRYFPGAMLRLALMLAACAVASYSLLSPMIFQRTRLALGQPAVDDRLTYLRVGAAALVEQPFGVGIGNQVLYSVRERAYQHFGMARAWQFEPVHNLYVLIAVELGLIGLLSFLCFLGMVVWRLIHLVTPEKALALALLCGLLTSGLFDHYLWTLQPGRLMLWVVIGVLLSLIGANQAVDKRR